MKKLYVELAQIVQAYQLCVERSSYDQLCVERSSYEWQKKHDQRLGELVHEHMPSGSGIDCGTSLVLDKSTGEKLVFETSYHHMNDAGIYDGWTEHTITVTASLSFGISIRIGGRNRNGIKDYLHDEFHSALMKEV